MDLWKKLNRDAMRFFNAQRYFHAVDKYTLAVKHACFLIDKQVDKQISTQNFITSLQGLSESYLQLNEYEYAVGSLIKGHKLMQGLIDINLGKDINIKHFHKAKCQLESYIAYLMTEYPQINICPQCYHRIFGYSDEQDSDVIIQ